jgi:cell division septum initiation protein DivIVA
MDYEDEDLFDVVMFGYRRDQVDKYLRVQTDQEQDRLARGLRIAELERQLAETLTENTKLRSTVARLTEDLTINRPTVTTSSRIQEMLRLAEEEAAAIRGEAAQYADQIRREAREDANLAAAQRRRGDTLSLSTQTEVAAPTEPKTRSVNGSKSRK